MAGQFKMNYSKLEGTAQDIIRKGGSMEKILDAAWQQVERLSKGWKSEAYGSLEKLYKANKAEIAAQTKELKGYSKAIVDSSSQVKKMDQAAKIKSKF